MQQMEELFRKGLNHSVIDKQFLSYYTFWDKILRGRQYRFGCFIERKHRPITNKAIFEHLHWSIL